MDLPALRTIPFWHGNVVARTDSVLAYGNRLGRVFRNTRNRGYMLFQGLSQTVAF